MEGLIYPRNVAVIGVSPALDNLAKNIVMNLMRFGFTGRVYPVGIKEGEVFEQKIYASVTDIEGEVDFASILTPAHTIPDILEECGKKGIKRALISSGGFTEFESEKRQLESRILDIATRYGIRFIGPNCIGIINLDNGLCTPFSPMDPEILEEGPNSIIVQSGGVTLQLGNVFSEEHLGVNKLISVGNKLNVDEVDLLACLIDDQKTERIFMYLEGISRGRELLRLARNSAKPIVIFKTNIHPSTAEIARSHTTALASKDEVVDAAFRQAGIMRVRSIKEMVTCAKALSLPPVRGDNLAVLSMSGGFAVITADACANYGFNLPALPEELLRYIEKHRRGGVIKLTNPMDFGDIYDLGMFLYAIEKVLELDYISALAVSMPFAPGMASRMAAVAEPSASFGRITDLIARYQKPVALSFFTRKEYIEEVKRRLALPVFDDTVESIQALAMLRDYWHLKGATGRDEDA